MTNAGAHLNIRSARDQYRWKENHRRCTKNEHRDSDERGRRSADDEGTVRGSSEFVH